ncbi:hypothetical protein Tco_0618311 [Tanacetum coccineum]
MGHGDWISLEFLDTANSGGKKETNAMVFHKMDTEDISDRFVAPCFVYGLEAYDGEINLGVEENMISNEFAVKLCLEHEVKRGNKVVKKELIAITNFETGTVTIYPELNPFLDSAEEEEKIGDDWDLLLDDLDFGDIPNIEGVRVRSSCVRWGKAVETKGSSRGVNPPILSKYLASILQAHCIETSTDNEYEKRIFSHLCGHHDNDSTTDNGKVATEMRSQELCHEFYSTYEFDEVCANDELKTKKIIKFKLGGRGLHSDEHFKAQEYWLSISQEENLSLSRSHASTIRNPLLARWMKRKGAGTQRESLICCGQFITKLARKERVLSDDVLRSLSALVYCRDMDTTTLRELIHSEGRLIPEAPKPGVPRVAVPRPQRALELARSSARSRL